MLPEVGEWHDAELRQAVAAMARYRGWWAVAGGWASDLHIGAPTRRHEDAEVAVLRADQSLVRATFDATWWYVEPHPHGLEDEGTVHPWSGHDLALPVHQLWADVGDRRLDLLLNESDDRQWRYRRYPAVAMPLGGAVRRRDRIPYLAPAIVLLFKSKHRRPKDDHDRELLQPLLTDDDRAWLRAALETADPTNPWLNDL